MPRAEPLIQHKLKQIYLHLNRLKSSNCRPKLCFQFRFGKRSTKPLENHSAQSLEKRHKSFVRLCLDPNITGSHRARSDTWFGDIVPEGAFYTDEETSNHSIIGVGSGSGNIAVGLNASLSNDLYSGNNLQVSALQALCCIKA